MFLHSIFNFQNMKQINSSFCVAALLMGLLLLPASRLAGQPTDVTVLKGATLFDGTGGTPVQSSVIVIRGRKIECVGSAADCSIPDNAKVVDATGKFITPGLVDAHVHFFQTAFFDSRPDALDLRETFPFSEVAAYQKLNPERYYDAYLCSGITAVYDVGGFTWSIDLQTTAETDPSAPHVAAAGPLLTPSALDLFNTPADKVLINLDSKETGAGTVRYLSDLGATGIKLWQLRPDDERYLSILQTVADQAAHKNNYLIVHATTLAQAKTAVELGAHLLVHSVTNTEVDKEFLASAKAQGTIYTPTLVVGSGYMLAYRAAAGVAPYPIDDPNQCVDAKTRELLETASRFKNHARFTASFLSRLEAFDPEQDRISDIALSNLKQVYEAGIPIAVGTDAGNPGTLHGVSIYDELEAMQLAGIPPADLIVMATRNGARAMKREKDFGTLEPGKMANLVILEKDPSCDIANMRSIRQVMIKGALKDVRSIQMK
jgi:imidazolonepropionase-like amidohydrolase